MISILTPEEIAAVLAAKPKGMALPTEEDKLRYAHALFGDGYIAPGEFAYCSRCGDYLVRTDQQLCDVCRNPTYQSEQSRDATHFELMQRRIRLARMRMEMGIKSRFWLSNEERLK